MKITKKPNLGNLLNLFNVYNKILSFGSLMKPTNLYLMTLFEISIFGHFGPQMQAGYLHSKIMDYFVKIAQKSPNLITNDSFEMARL